MYFSTACGYNAAEMELYGLPENYLSVVNLDYYMPVEIEADLDLPTLPNGDKDSVYALYSN